MVQGTQGLPVRRAIQEVALVFLVLKVIEATLASQGPQDFQDWMVVREGMGRLAYQGPKVNLVDSPTKGTEVHQAAPGNQDSQVTEGHRDHRGLVIQVLSVLKVIRGCQADQALPESQVPKVNQEERSASLGSPALRGFRVNPACQVSQVTLAFPDSLAYQVTKD